MLGETVDNNQYYRISLVELLKKLVKEEPGIFDELSEARKQADIDERQGYLSDVRHGSVYRGNNLLMNDSTRDRTFALVVHSDEVDTAANQLGSRSGRSLLVASVAIGNAQKWRLLSPDTFLIASKEVAKAVGYSRLFGAFLQEISQCRQGISTHHIYIYISLNGSLGIEVNVAGKATVFHADILFWTADSLEANRLGGWSGNATCRHCYVPLARVREGTAPHETALRTMADYTRAIDAETRQRGAAKAQGIQSKSFLCALPDFDVVAQVGQDHVMHDELEGAFACMYIYANTKE